MKLSDQEKKILNTVFKDITGTTRDRMLLALYAAKPAPDSGPEAPEIITLLNGLIAKIYHAEPAELEAVFAGIPYTV